MGCSLTRASGTATKAPVMSARPLDMWIQLTAISQLEHRVPKCQCRGAFSGRLREVVYVEMPFLCAGRYDLGHIILWCVSVLGHC